MSTNYASYPDTFTSPLASPRTESNQPHSGQRGRGSRGNAAPRQEWGFVSRGGGETLLEVEKQKELMSVLESKIEDYQRLYRWEAIPLKVPQDGNEKKVYDQHKDATEGLVGLFRRLREGVFASDMSNGDFDFAMKVYERAVDVNLLARDFSELIKSLKVLVEFIYPAFLSPPQTLPRYVSYYALYHMTHLSAFPQALALLHSHDLTVGPLQTARRILMARIHINPITYFRIRENVTDVGERVLLDAGAEEVAKDALKVLGKAYYSVEAEWAGRWIGVRKTGIRKTDEVSEAEILEKIKSGGGVVEVDGGIIWFRKPRKK